ncbi:MAG TPA: thiol:disulfide interchange protein DsbA/DsbL [Nevskia sp.]|jgi:thiol:disulfide interchange protein DsbA|nr:thiol:disulfide interchange protein DsbA/DsbL [Nevskia sp.]
MRLLKHGLFAALGLLAAACHAADPADAYVEGKNYRVAATPVKQDNPKRITVEEFFWYGCPHCYHLEPEVDAWLKHKPADVDFVRVPNTLGRPIGELHQRAFYIAEALGILDKTHRPLFDAIHAQGFPMSTLESIRDLYVEKGGIKPEQFDADAHSFVVENNMRRADDLAAAYGITGTPTFVVGGKYVVDAQNDVLKVVDAVIAKVRKERK